MVSNAGATTYPWGRLLMSARAGVWNSASGPVLSTLLGLIANIVLFVVTKGHEAQGWERPTAIALICLIFVLQAFFIYAYRRDAADAASAAGEIERKLRSEITSLKNALASEAQVGVRLGAEIASLRDEVTRGAKERVALETESTSLKAALSRSCEDGWHKGVSVPDIYLHIIEQEARHNDLDHLRAACFHALWCGRPDRAKPILEDGQYDERNHVSAHATRLLTVSR